MIHEVDSSLTYTSQEQINNLIQTLKVYSLGLFNRNKIIVKTLDNVFFIVVDRIIRCEAWKNYTTIIQIGESDIVVSRTLKDFEELLNLPIFLRIHQSHLINVNFIRRYDKASSCLIMNDNSKIPISFRKRAILNKYIQSLPTP